MKTQPINNSTKNGIRNEMKEKRSKVKEREFNDASNKVSKSMESIVEMFDYDTYFVYNSANREISTQKIIELLLEKGKKVYMPRIEDDDTMSAVKVDGYTMFTINHFGILEPEGFPEDIDDFVCVVPCLAIDKDGNRLGFGKGYYDKFLQDKDCLKIALAYDFQYVDKLPTKKTDVPVDVLITPTVTKTFSHHKKSNSVEQKQPQ